MEPYIFSVKSGENLNYYIRISLRVYTAKDPRVSQRWVTVNGVNKNIEKYDYSTNNLAYKNGDVILPNFKPNSNDIYDVYIGNIKTMNPMKVDMHNK